MNAPPNQIKVDDENGVDRRWKEFFSAAFNNINAMQSSGTTAQRPVSSLWIGRPYFDTTLGYSINLKSINPNVWVNGIGTIV